MMIFLELKSGLKFSTSCILCLCSITKISSAHSTRDEDTRILAALEVPADFTLKAFSFLKMVSAVLLLHLFLLQIKSTFTIELIKFREYFSNAKKSFLVPAYFSYTGFLKSLVNNIQKECLYKLFDLNL